MLTNLGIYNDLKILKELYVLKNNKGFYQIEGERPPLTKRELNALTAAVNASPLSKGSPFEKQLRKALEKLHRPLANHIHNQIGKTTDISIQLKTGDRYEQLDEYFTIFEKALYEKKRYVQNINQQGRLNLPNTCCILTQSSFGKRIGTLKHTPIHRRKHH